MDSKDNSSYEKDVKNHEEGYPFIQKINSTEELMAMCGTGWRNYLILILIYSCKFKILICVISLKN